MRTIITSVFTAGLVLLLGGLAWIYSGRYDMAATDPHWQVTRWVLERARMRSIKVHAAGVVAPPGLDDPARILIGVAHFAAHCAICHGAPGVPKGDIARGLYPSPPDLAKAAPPYSPAELFWILKHGIKMTGMPAWSRPQRRGALGDRCVSRKAARHERAGLCQARDGEHSPRRPPTSRQCRRCGPRSYPLEAEFPGASLLRLKPFAVRPI